jgi:zinc transport system substrate-binding protein
MRNTLLVALFTVMAATGRPATAGAPAVVTSILPVHSLVAAVMRGVGEPVLLVSGSGSPHHYALKPSQAQALQSADLVFWVGEDLESFLVKPMQTVGSGAISVPLSEAPDIVRHAYRDLSGDRKLNQSSHRHTHTIQAIDPHFWLDPENAVRWLTVIADQLAERDPDNRLIYRQNASAQMAQIEELSEQIAARLEGLQAIPFAVFHDGYRYFEARYGLQSVAAITLSPEAQPSAERIRRIGRILSETQAVCVFSEPQFPPKLVKTVTEGLTVREGVLDPLGSQLVTGPELYLELLEQMTMSFEQCLKAK